MILKQVIKYKNANVLEATWVEVIASEELVVKCQAYDEYQMDLLRADLGENITPEIETLIKEVLEEQKPIPVPQPPTVMEQILALESTITIRRLREATLTEEGKLWLANTDKAIKDLRMKL